jgi:hypothetical protein
MATTDQTADGSSDPEPSLEHADVESNAVEAWEFSLRRWLKKQL